MAPRGALFLLLLKRECAMSQRFIVACALLAAGLTSVSAEAQTRMADNGIWVGGQFYGHDPLGKARRNRGEAHAPTEVQQVQFEAPEPTHLEAELANYDEQESLEAIDPSHFEDSVGCCETCADPCCDAPGCGSVCRPKRKLRYYAGAEYLYGWTKGADIPALVTTSTAGTTQGDAGVLGVSSTSLLLGNEEINDGGQSGARFTFGAVFDPCQQKRVEFVYSYFDDSGESFADTSDNLGILARPFYNVSTAEQDALLIGFPAFTEGSLGVNASSEFHSFEIHYRQNVRYWRGAKVEWLAGYRALDLDDSLTINSTSTALSGPTTGAITNVQDGFFSGNTFHGGQVGFSVQLARGKCWSYDCTLKTALGVTDQTARVSGSTSTTTGGATTTASGGLLAQGTNIGSYTNDEFSAVTEVGLDPASAASTGARRWCLGTTWSSGVTWCEPASRSTRT